VVQKVLFRPSVLFKWVQVQQKENRVLRHT